MTTTSQATSYEQTLHAALELSKSSWLLAIQIPGRDNPSLHPITGGDADGPGLAGSPSRLVVLAIVERVCASSDQVGMRLPQPRPRPAIS